MPWRQAPPCPALGPPPPPPLPCSTRLPPALGWCLGWSGSAPPPHACTLLAWLHPSHPQPPASTHPPFLPATCVHPLALSPSQPHQPTLPFTIVAHLWLCLCFSPLASGGPETTGPHYMDFPSPPHPPCWSHPTCPRPPFSPTPAPATQCTGRGLRTGPALSGRVPVRCACAGVCAVPVPCPILASLCPAAPTHPPTQPWP